MATCPLVFGQGSTLLRCLRPGQAGPACPNGGATTTDLRLMLKFMKIHYFYYFSPYKYLFVLEVKETNFLSAEIFNDKDDLKHQSSREGTNIEYFLVAAGQSHLYLINEVLFLTELLRYSGKILCETSFDLQTPSGYHIAVPFAS